MIDPAQEEDKTSVEQTTEDTEVLEGGQDIVEEARKRRGSALKKGVEKIGNDVVSGVSKAAAGSGAAIKRGAGQVAQGVSETAKKAGKAASDVTNKTLEGIGTDPDEDPVVTKRVGVWLMKLLPVVGSTPQYADARLKFRKAVKEENEELKQEARVEFMQSCWTAGIDIATIPLTAVGKGLQLANKLGPVGTAYRAVSNLPGVKHLRRVIKVPSFGFDKKLAEKVLKSDFAVKVADKALSVANPEDYTGEPQRS